VSYQGRLRVAELLKPKDVAVRLGVTRRTLERWAARKIGPPVIRVGRAVFYRAEAIEAWLRSNESRGDE
jgi:predicted DNA-binding transcriptional regulator AlpA